MEMFRNTFAEINLEHIIHNFNLIKSIAKDDRFICPMVKANAYGHGDIQVANTLQGEGAQHLGVCLIEEGLLLRNSGIKSDIFVFRGFDKRGAEKILEYQMTPVVSSWQQLESLDSAADNSVKVHIKFNTGMNRLGFEPEDSEKLRDYFKKSKKIKLKALLTHFANSDDLLNAEGLTQKQIKKFENVLNYFSDQDVFAHAHNSGAIAALASAQAQTQNNNSASKWGFRPGLILYGYSPLATHLDFKPVMTLKSVVNNIKKVSVGETVSYGATWKAERPTTLAVVPIGYADGVHRLISNKAQVLFKGQLVPVIGRVCMDFLMLDITDLNIKTDENFHTDNEVTFFGYDENQKFLSVQKMAESAQTIAWECLTSVGERVPRHFKGLKQI